MSGKSKKWQRHAPPFFEGLECPATWDYCSLTNDACDDQVDKLCLSATPWTDVLERIYLASSLYINHRGAEGRTLLVEAYMYLLPYDFFHKDCAVVHEYRHALRFVLDSSWVTISDERCTDTKDIEYLKKYLDEVKSRRPSSIKQVSAMYAIRGRCTSKEKWLRKSIAMRPQEGEWCYLLGWQIQEARGLDVPSDEELALLRKAYRLRKNPDTVTRLARSLIELGLDAHLEARALVDEALFLYPDHPRVHTQVANIVMRVKGTDSDEVLAEVRELYRRAVAAVGDRAFLHVKLAAVYMTRGQRDLGLKHLNKAFDLNPATCRIMGPCR